MGLPVTAPTSNPLKDVVFHEDFYDLDTVQTVLEECLASSGFIDFVDPIGIFKGQLIAQHLWITEHSSSFSRLIDQTLEYFKPCRVIETLCVKLHLPWDIHTDMVRPGARKPFYNVLIPLEPAESRTIVFDQQADYNDFWLYKQQNPKTTDPVPQHVWDQWLDMCWPDDRLWLSIREIFPAQRPGQMIAFRRNFFHSSDNFHRRQSRPKHFIQMILDEI